MILHPATRFAAWIGLAAIMPWLSAQDLAWLGTGVALLCLVLPAVAWQRYLRRSSVLLLSLWLVYAFATPGQAWFSDWSWSPTLEGMHAGLLQAARLATLLLALALVLAHLSREQLFVGIHTLLAPLRVLGLPVDKLATRLWLTLHYADAAPAAAPMSRLEALLEPGAHGPAQVTLTLPGFGRVDVLFALCCLMIAMGLLA